MSSIKKSIFRFQKGFSLIEILLVSAILLTISLAIGSLVFQMQKAAKLAEKKVEALELRAAVSRILMNLPVCSCILNSYASPFRQPSPSGRAETNVTQLEDNCGSTAPQLIAAANAYIPGSRTRLKLGNISLSNIRPDPSTVNRFRGELRVDFDGDGDIQLQSFDFDIDFTTIGPLEAKDPTTCTYVAGLNGSAGIPGLFLPPGTSTQTLGTCPTGEVLTGIQSSGITCVDVNTLIVSSGFTPPSGWTPPPVTSPTPPPPPAWSPSNPGPGCSGSSCITYDYGPCDGSSCWTNGNYCDGPSCVATGVTAGCNGSSCCAGPPCGGP